MKKMIAGLALLLLSSHALRRSARMPAFFAGIF